jgi:glutaredoxin
MPHVTLYSKPGCHLCDDARTYLDDLASTTDFDLDEIDIRRDSDLFEQYRYRIPVITVDGIERLEGRVTAEDVRTLTSFFP